MRPVEQQEPYGCLRACVASILELAYTDVPASLALEEGQTTAFLRFMASRGFSIGDYSLSGSPGVPADPPMHSTRYWPTYWIASVLSPRFFNDEGKAGLHAIVMQGSELVWDPHPDRKDGHSGFVHAYVPYVIDPARVVMKVIP